MAKDRFEISDEQLYELYDLAWRQLKEDREIVSELYQSLKKELFADPSKYAISGDTLAKYAELLTKQTAQVQELLKITQKQRNDEKVITDEDLSSIADAIEKKE